VKTLLDWKFNLWSLQSFSKIPLSAAALLKPHFPKGGAFLKIGGQNDDQ
jgi:hypothetical protein